MALTRQSTITISIVCSPEQLADVQVRVSALQADLAAWAVDWSLPASEVYESEFRACRRKDATVGSAHGVATPGRLHDPDG
jgi:hypothetical protein